MSYCGYNGSWYCPIYVFVSGLFCLLFYPPPLSHIRFLSHCLGLHTHVFRRIFRGLRLRFRLDPNWLFHITMQIDWANRALDERRWCRKRVSTINSQSVRKKSTDSSKSKDDDELQDRLLPDESSSIRDDARVRSTSEFSGGTSLMKIFPAKSRDVTSYQRLRRIRKQYAENSKSTRHEPLDGWHLQTSDPQLPQDAFDPVSSNPHIVSEKFVMDTRVWWTVPVCKLCNRIENWLHHPRPRHPHRIIYTAHMSDPSQ